MSIETESHYTRLEQIRHQIKAYKDQWKYWERLETEELILLGRALESTKAVK